MPRWLRIALGYTTALNLFGAVSFSPLGRPIQRWAEFPDAPDLYLWSVASFILGMGGAYGWMCWTNRPNRLVIALACYGKATFALILFQGYLTDALPLLGALSGLPDLILAGLFGAWLLSTRHPDPTTSPAR